MIVDDWENRVVQQQYDSFHTNKTNNKNSVKKHKQMRPIRGNTHEKENQQRNTNNNNVKKYT